MYAFNIGDPKYIKKILTALKGEVDNRTITVGEFNTPLMDRSSKRKLIKK